MKKRVVQALGCILAMTMVVGSLTACGGKSEKKAEKKAGSDVCRWLCRRNNLLHQGECRSHSNIRDNACRFPASKYPQLYDC